MEALADNRHLISRNGIWYYRRRVPDDLRPIMGTVELMRSLKTTSITEARTQRAGLDLRYDLEFADLRSELKKNTTSAPIRRLTAAEVHARVQMYVDQQIVAHEGRYLAAPAASMEELTEARLNKAIDLQTINDLDHPEQHERVALIYDRVLGSSDLDGLTEAGAAEIVRRGLGALLGRQLSFLEGTSVDWIVRTMPSTGEHRNSVTLGEIAREYLGEETKKAQLNRRRPAWIEKIEAHVQLVLEVVGPTTTIEAVDYDAAIGLRDLVARLPAHRDKRYRGLSPTAAAEQAERSGGALLSPTSQKFYLDVFRSIMALAAKRRLIPNNPAEQVRPLIKDQVGASEKRIPFTNEQICTFFGSSFYDHWRNGSVKPYRKPDREWRFWLPLLMAMTGMRPGEACQMLVGDIQRTASGVWFAHVIASDDDDEGSAQKRLKTSQSRRSFPIHPRLIEVGFLDFVQQRRERGGHTQSLLHGLRRSKRGYPSDYPCRRLRETFLPTALEVLPRQTFYSFRHSFRDALRRIDAPSDVVSVLGGWSEGAKVSDAYGNKNDPDYLARYVSRIEYPGLAFDFRWQML